MQLAERRGVFGKDCTCSRRRVRLRLGGASILCSRFVENLFLPPQPTEQDEHYTLHTNNAYGIPAMMVFSHKVLLPEGKLVVLRVGNGGQPRSVFAL